jgi:hypothetical protein
MIPFSGIGVHNLINEVHNGGDVATSSQSPGGGGGVPVRLAVYDVSYGWARRLSPLLFCKKIPVAPHTGILIFGHEYFWWV